MKHCAILTSEEIPDLLEEDRPLIPALEKVGWHARPVIWNQPQDSWKQFDAVMVRTPWDYHHYYHDFIKVMQEIHQQTKLINPYDVILWNADKTYLFELLQKELSVLPMVPIEQEIDDSFGNEIIVKPLISAGAFHTYRIAREQLPELKKRLSTEAPHKTFVVQPFVESITQEGEWSFMFFNSEYSFAIRKTPKSEDFRVQEEHGGKVLREEPSVEDIEQAKQIIAALPNYIYARVDMVRWQNKLHLIELELIEPQLFFAYHPPAIQDFVDAFLKTQ